MKDGEVYPEVLTNEDETEYYIFRLDSEFDKDATESEKGTILYDRKQDNYESIIEEWKESMTINVEDSLLAKIKITDSEPFEFATESTVAESESTLAESGTAN